tara:strand:- start:1081 stop:1383 length:303 start_codon:yes stop_codon:yes gene_type:complete
MKIELDGKQFSLRCDMLALARAKREAGIDIAKIDEDVVQVGTLIYYMAASGAKKAGVPFKYEADDFLALIAVDQLPYLMEALGAIMGGGEEKKAKAKAKA